MTYQKELNQLTKYLREKDLKESEQRNLILKIFLKTKKHLTVKKLHRLALESNASIGLATIYRNLKLFKECGLSEELRLNDGTIRYEPKSAHHDHLICAKCNKIIEIYSSKIEKLQEQIAQKNGFKLESHRMELYGVCDKCNKN